MKKYDLDVDEFEWEVWREDFSYDQYYAREYQDIDIGLFRAVVDSEGYILALGDYGIPDRDWLLELWQKNAPHPDQKFPLRDGRELTYPELLEELEKFGRKPGVPNGKVSPS